MRLFRALSPDPNWECHSYLLCVQELRWARARRTYSSDFMLSITGDNKSRSLVRKSPVTSDLLCRCWGWVGALCLLGFQIKSTLQSVIVMIYFGWWEELNVVWWTFAALMCDKVSARVFIWACVDCWGLPLRPHWGMLCVTPAVSTSTPAGRAGGSKQKHIQ